MADLETWDWSVIEPPSALKLVPVTSTVVASSEAGYDATRPRWTRNRMKVLMEWSEAEGWMGPASFDALLNFFWSQKGQARPFYFQLPVGLYGYPPPYGGGVEPGGSGPFNSELEVGFGEGPVWIVRFTQDELPLKHLFPNRWCTENAVELLRV